MFQLLILICILFFFVSIINNNKKDTHLNGSRIEYTGGSKKDPICVLNPKQFVVKATKQLKIHTLHQHVPQIIDVSAKDVVRIHDTSFLYSSITEDNNLSIKVVELSTKKKQEQTIVFEQMIKNEDHKILAITERFFILITALDLFIYDILMQNVWHQEKLTIFNIIDWDNILLKKKPVYCLIIPTSSEIYEISIDLGTQTLQFKKKINQYYFFTDNEFVLDNNEQNVYFSSYEPKMFGLFKWDVTSEYTYIIYNYTTNNIIYQSDEKIRTFFVKDHYLLISLDTHKNNFIVYNTFTKRSIYTHTYNKINSMHLLDDNSILISNISNITLFDLQTLSFA